MAVLAATVVLPANDLIATSVYLWRVHDVLPMAWVPIEALVLVAAYLFLAAALAFTKRTLPSAGADAAWLLIVAALAWVGFAGMAYAVLGAESTPRHVVAAWALGAVPASLVAVLSRRVELGRVAFGFAMAAALAPLVLVAVRQQPHRPAIAVALPASEVTPSVVWVVADSLRGDLVFDSKGQVRPIFPNLSALASTATAYPYAYTVANATEVAVPGMLAGVSDVAEVANRDGAPYHLDEGIIGALAPTHEIVVLSPLEGVECTPLRCRSTAVGGAGSVWERYWAFGQDEGAVVGNRSLAPPLSHPFPATSFAWGGFWQPELDRLPVGKFVGEYAAALGNGAGRPVFGLWHTLVTHAPWTVDGQGSDIVPAHIPVVAGAPWIGTSVSQGLLTEDVASLTRWLYVTSAVEFDRQLGVLLDFLRDSGQFDRTVVVVTADHGEALTVGEVDTRDPRDRAALWNQVARVPLIVKGVSQDQSSVVMAPRSLAQLPATVLEELEASIGDSAPFEPDLRYDLSQPPALTIVDGGTFETVRYRDTLSDEEWTTVDLSGATGGEPTTIGLRPMVVGAPVPPGWEEVPVTEVQVVSADSPLALYVPTAASGAPCPDGRVGAASHDGTVVGAVHWENGPRTEGGGVRGWAPLPRNSGADLRWWCPTGPS